MAKINVGINGFGRIGRLMVRSILSRHADQVNIVGVNDVTDPQTLAYLFKHDSVHGPYEGSVSAEEDAIIIDDMKIGVSSKKDPAQLEWDERGADIVVESTGLFRHRSDAEKHLQAGAAKVIISAPAKSGDVPTVCLGVNDEIISDDIEIYSNASCTTNCLAPMVYVLDEAFGLEKGFMTTVHAYTASQQIIDGPHKDLRRARTAAQNVVPTTTGAAQAVEEVLPQLKSKLDGSAMRVPVADGSITDLTVIVENEVSTDKVTEAFKNAAADELNGILQYSEAELVSTDILGNPHSCIFDSKMTKTDGKLIKIMAWYDNEVGYATRTGDLITRIA